MLYLFWLFDIHFRSTLEIVDLQLSPPRTWMHEAQMYKGIWFLATQNTFKNCTKLGTIYVMRQIWQSRDNMWSQWTQWVEIRLKVEFHFFVDMCFHKIFMHNSCYNSTIKMKSYWVCHYYGGAKKKTRWEPTNASDYLFFAKFSSLQSWHLRKAPGTFSH